VRDTKEQLFTRGQVDVALVTDQLVKVSKDEFESYAPMQKLSGEFQVAIQAFLSKVDPSWGKATDSPMMVLTGGSARLPFISALSQLQWNIGQKRFKFSKAKALPDIIADTFAQDFQREYPQLAVAIGGVLPTIDQKSEFKEWHGGTTAPGNSKNMRSLGELSCQPTLYGILQAAESSRLRYPVSEAVILGFLVTLRGKCHDCARQSPGLPARSGLLSPPSNVSPISFL
jgi:hypothetical protein